MFKNLILFFSFFLTITILGQDKRITKDASFNPLGIDSTRIDSTRARPSDSLKIFIPKITDYLYWKESKKTFEPIDTTLTLESFYEQNFLREDLFGNMQFPNIGQTLNPLEYRAQENNTINFLPFGKSFNYITEEDIRYFDVKTPITEFFYENGVREGQTLSTLFSHSPNKQFNYTVMYRGLRSLGRFQESLAANGSFISSIYYRNRSERFKLWAHYTSQNIDNEENAGIQNITDFTDSEVSGGIESLDVNLTGVRSEFDSRRFIAGTSYGLLKRINPIDSTTYHPIELKNKFSYEKQKFLYVDEGTNSTENDTFYGSSTISGSNRENLRSFERLQNTTTAGFNWGEKLFIEAGVKYENIQFYAETALQDGLINIPERVEDNLFSVLGNVNFDWNEKIQLTGNVDFTQGDFFGTTYNVNAELDVQPINGYKISGGVLVQSVYPSLNLLLNQSFYEDFNYYNADFVNQDTQKLYGKISSEKYNVSLEGSIFNITNYTYVDTNARPQQLNSDLSIFKIRANYHGQYKNYHLNLNAQYQSVNTDTVLPLPEYFGRLTVYYQNHAFKKAAQIQTGFNLNYFGNFKSREFFAITNEFVLSEDSAQEIGNFPLLDIFFNLKVKRMQIFFRADHIFGAFGDRNYFSTPNIPFRNFKIQFGIKWYLFT